MWLVILIAMLWALGGVVFFLVLRKDPYAPLKESAILSCGWPGILILWMLARLFPIELD